MTGNEHPPLYPFQQKALDDLCRPDGAKRTIIGTGCGTSAVSLLWAKHTNKPNVLVVTTASKRDSQDYVNDAITWCGKEWLDSRKHYEVISWAGLSKWWKERRDKASFDISEWCFIYDEIASAKSGVSSQRGRAFLQIASQTGCWTGYTATPGDRWIDFQAYFVATHKVKNKSDFIRDFCKVQTFKGFPEIVGYENEDTMRAWWDEISTRPDTSQMLKELPPETHKIVPLPKPKGYDKFMEERISPYTKEFVDTTMGVCATARRMCFSKEKKQWITDFLENLGRPCVFFVNFIDEEQEMEALAKKLKLKVWRIDGSHHDIPTKDTIGKTDIIVANYGAGAEGLNLQFVHYYVSVSYNYSYTKSVQSRGRIRRIGQDNAQFYYYLETKGTIEQAVKKCLKQKSDFSAEVWAAEELDMPPSGEV